MHNNTGSIIISIAKKRIDGPTLELLVACLAMIVSIISAYILYVWVEKPSQRVSSLIKYKGIALKPAK